MMPRSQKLLRVDLILVVFFLYSSEAILFGRRGGAENSSDDKIEPVSPIAEAAEDADSASVDRLEGWFIIHVIGTGTRCLEGQQRLGKSLTEDFGNTTDTSAFLDLYGTHECQGSLQIQSYASINAVPSTDGDVGVWKGKVRAWIVLEAYQRGEQCVGQVFSEVVLRQAEIPVLPTIRLNLNGVTDGEILSVCNDN